MQPTNSVHTLKLSFSIAAALGKTTESISCKKGALPNRRGFIEDAGARAA